MEFLKNLKTSQQIGLVVFIFVVILAGIKDLQNMPSNTAPNTQYKTETKTDDTLRYSAEAKNIINSAGFQCNFVDKVIVIYSTSVSCDGYTNIYEINS